MYANDVCIIHTQKAVGSLYRIKYTVPTVFNITIEQTPIISRLTFGVFHGFTPGLPFENLLLLRVFCLGSTCFWEFAIRVHNTHC